MRRENIEWCQFHWADTQATHLPRVLLVGDSIVAGHRGVVAERLRDKAAVAAYSTSKIVGDPRIAGELALALAHDRVDLVVFNNGLHGMDAPDDAYRAGLESFVDQLRESTAARLHWRNSTPIRGEDGDGAPHPEKNAVVLRRNAIAAEIMARHAIPTLDLYTPALAHPEYSAADGVHFNEAGNAVLGGLAADYVERALANDLAPILELPGGTTTNYPGVLSDWRGFARRDFLVDGFRCVLVAPNGPAAAGRPWLWRARFFGAFPTADLALLRRGWHIVNVDVPELYGSPAANGRFDALYRFMTAVGFNRRCILAGFSRGGLDAGTWSEKHPDRVAGLYLDNAVVDFKSWPGGKGRGVGDSECWARCLDAWGFTEAEALAFRGNPVDDLAPLAKAGVPILAVCAEADEVVPADENTRRLEARYRELGGPVETIYKPGARHHPHCLADPTPIVDFCERAMRRRQAGRE